MTRKLTVLFMLGVLMVACGDDDTSGTNSNDAGMILDSHVSSDASAIIECTPTNDQCTGSVDCLCCGSIGPAPICLCTSSCDSDTDCTAPERPRCNKPSPSVSGICTTVGFNCCWGCQ